MEKLISIFSFLASLSLTSVFAQETLTITTYYPAPYGVYTNLRLFPSAQPACAVANDEGVMYFDNGSHRLLVCTGDGAVPPHFTWQTAGGLWSVGGQIPNQYIYANNQNWKVGIGTDNPLERLTVTGATPGPGGADGILIDGPGPSELVIYNGLPPFTTANELLALGGVVSAENFATGTLAGDAVLRSVNGRLIFGTGNVNGNTPSRMTITNGGNVGINTMAPLQTLDVNGAIRIGPGGGGIHSRTNGNWGGKETVYTTADGLGGDNDEVWIGPNVGAWKGHVQMTGEHLYLVTHGNSGNPPGTIDLVAHEISMATTGGTVKVDGTTVHTSDVSLKKDIVTIPNSLERVSKLRGVNFHWKSKESEQGLQMGLIAQETEKEFPEVVYTEKDGKKSIAYTQLIGALVESIKELKKDNDSLRQTVQELKTKIK